MHDLELIPTRYMVETGFDRYRKFKQNEYHQLPKRLDVTLRNKELNLWSIDSSDSACWNIKTECFEYQPMPSSRTEEFISETRFTIKQCKEIILKIFQLYNMGVEEFQKELKSNKII